MYPVGYVEAFDGFASMTILMVATYVNNFSLCMSMFLFYFVFCVSNPDMVYSL